jgi:hypothetical protein
MSHPNKHVRFLDALNEALWNPPKGSGLAHAGFGATKGEGSLQIEFEGRVYRLRADKHHVYASWWEDEK